MYGGKLGGRDRILSAGGGDGLRIGGGVLGSGCGCGVGGLRRRLLGM